MGHFPASFFFIFVFSIQLWVNIQCKFCGWLDSNSGLQESEATSLPTESQPLPNLRIILRQNLPENFSSRGPKIDPILERFFQNLDRVPDAFRRKNLRQCWRKKFRYGSSGNGRKVRPESHRGSARSCPSWRRHRSKCFSAKIRVKSFFER